MIHRIEVWPKSGSPDPRGDAACREAAGLGLAVAPSRIECASVYLIEGALDRDQVRRIAEELLADPITEQAVIHDEDSIARVNGSPDAIIEVHPLPGVMDPDAEPIEQAIRALVGVASRVRTGRRFDFYGSSPDVASDVARRTLANTVIHAIHDEPFHPEAFAKGHAHDMGVREVPLLELDDAALTKLSREAHLFLNLEEMKAIQAEYRRFGRNPREIELETLAQTWSEHCVHKTLKATIRYRETIDDDQCPRIAIRRLSRPGHEENSDGSITIHNLLKSTVAAATHELIADGVDWCLSVFKDNAGVIAFDDEHAVCFKVETHNHPSAIEPYGGAATGIGGCIRDVIGTGLAAKPIANTDVFCVAFPDHFTAETQRTQRKMDLEEGDSITISPRCDLSVSAVNLPSGCLHPRRILTQVVAGVRDYGNRMGIPTLNGAVWFDDRYVGNPLVYCGCVGVMPRDRVEGDPKSGDHIIALGGRTGRDGIHGATFSSAELTDTHADEFSHAVQIGNAVTEKKVLDAILEAREHQGTCLYNAITDCGAGGFSSAVGEMGAELGAHVHLERAPLKYEGLTPTEIWISEAQERMVLAVPPENIGALKEICAKHDVECCDLGTFGTDQSELILTFEGNELGRLSMHFLHEGLPETVREATWELPSPPGRGAKGEGVFANDGGSASSRERAARPGTLEAALLTLLAHPNIASKHWIIRQYDHEVQGNAAINPLVGPAGEGPSDASVILPVPNSTRGLAIANGLATGHCEDPYIAALFAIDECVRNLVCVGADPSRIAILDNFCWPGCDKPELLGALVRAAEGCYDAAKAYRTPFISGKDSLNNQFTTESGETIRIPPTLLISGFGIVPDVRGCVTMDAKRAGNLLVFVGGTQPSFRGSHCAMMFDVGEELLKRPYHVDLDFGPAVARYVHDLIRSGLVVSAHDGNEGGLLVTVAEMCIGGGLGLDLDGHAALLRESPIDEYLACFGEAPSCYFLEIAPEHLQDVQKKCADAGFDEWTTFVVGRFNDSGRLTLGDRLDVSIDDLRAAWRGTLDW